MPKFIIKGMENSYVEEQKATINQLMMNLEQFPVGKTGAEGKNALYKMKKFAMSHFPYLTVIIYRYQWTSCGAEARTAQRVAIPSMLISSIDIFIMRSISICWYLF